MKKFLLVAFIATLSIASKAQPIILSENFDTYNGLVASIPAGFIITWNDTNAISRSYYSSSGFCGVACNSYKFGWDSATIITPMFSNPGSVSFYLKGNGTPNPYNTFYVYETPDGSTWNQVASYVNFSTSSQTIVLPLNNNSIQLKFYYDKDSLGFNAGFDDLIVYGPTGVSEVRGLDNISIYPTPSSGLVTVNFSQRAFAELQISVLNILGKEIKKFNLRDVSSKFQMNLSELPDGMYFVKIKSEGEENIQRIVIKK